MTYYCPIELFIAGLTHGTLALAKMRTHKEWALALTLLLITSLDLGSCKVYNTVAGDMVKHRYSSVYNGFHDIRSNLFERHHAPEQRHSTAAIYSVSRKRNCNNISSIICISCDTFEKHDSKFCPWLKLYSHFYMHIIHNCTAKIKRISNYSEALNCTNYNMDHLSWSF